LVLVDPPERKIPLRLAWRGWRTESAGFSGLKRLRWSHHEKAEAWFARASGGAPVLWTRTSCRGQFTRGVWGSGDHFRDDVRFWAEVPAIIVVKW